MCNDCVKLTLLNEDLIQQNIGLKRSNVILRKVNSNLHSRLADLQAHADAVFSTLCEEGFLEDLDFDNITSIG